MSPIISVFQFQCMPCVVTFSTHASKCGDQAPYVPRSFGWKLPASRLPTDTPQPTCGGQKFPLHGFLPPEKYRCCFCCDLTDPNVPVIPRDIRVLPYLFYIPKGTMMHLGKNKNSPSTSHHHIGSLVPQSASFIITRQCSTAFCSTWKDLCLVLAVLLVSASSVPLSKKTYSWRGKYAMENSPIPSPVPLTVLSNDAFMSFVAPTCLLILSAVLTAYVFGLSPFFFHEIVCFRMEPSNNLITLQIPGIE